MRFLDFLNETSNRAYSPQHVVSKVIPEIGSECQAFLGAAAGMPLYRGIGAADDIPRFTMHPVERPPRDSTLGQNCVFNLMILAAFGIDKIRQHSIFCTGDLRECAEYGTPNYIFPRGNFKILYSTKVKDSIMYAGKWIQSIEAYIIANGKGMEVFKEGDLLLTSFFEITASIFSLWDLGWVKRPSDNQCEEILRWMKQSATSPMSDKQKAAFDEIGAEEITQLLIKALRDLGKKFYCYDGDIETAIKSRCEILIFQSDGYFSVPLNDVTDLFDDDSHGSGPYESFLNRINDAI
jgi:hypothetical protein